MLWPILLYIFSWLKSGLSLLLIFTVKSFYLLPDEEEDEDDLELPELELPELPELLEAPDDPLLW
jgi:hypothetical protein